MNHETAIKILGEIAALKQTQARELDHVASSSPLEKADNRRRADRLRQELGEISGAVAALAGECQRSEPQRSEGQKSEVSNHKSEMVSACSI